MKIRVIHILAILGAAAALAIPGMTASQNQGAGQILLNGGSRGNVPFPHFLHQNGLKDCRLCHDLFPQESGSIERLKDQGALSAKQVMNTQCIQCHRAEKRAGKTAGPTTCTQCHQKG